MITLGRAGQARALSQLVAAPLTPAAIFLVVTVNPGPEAETGIRSLCADMANLLRAVGFRDLEGRLSCIMSFGSEVWDRLFGELRPAELHPFREFRAGAPIAGRDAGRHPVSYSRPAHGSVLRTREPDHEPDQRRTLRSADEVHGFSFFDQRDLLGFVDGTENPEGQAAKDAVFVGDEDPGFTGGSYVIVQKYLHDLDAWNALPTEAQERIIGRTKLTNVELDAAVKPSFAHNELTKIVENGEEVKIVRDNMPFGEVGKGDFGTYFIGYARSPRTIEQMLENMFIGKPPGNYDRILDFSRAVTGNLFFAPTATFLENVSVDAPAAAPAADPPQPTPPVHDGSLGIGSLKRGPRNE